MDNTGGASVVVGPDQSHICRSCGGTSMKGVPPGMNVEGSMDNQELERLREEASRVYQDLLVAQDRYGLLIAQAQAAHLRYKILEEKWKDLEVRIKVEHTRRQHGE